MQTIYHMEEFKYKIQFHSPWHCGSGLSAGADVDALVVKDKNGLPFIPGKTLKGLIREAVEDYVSFTNMKLDERIIKTFGRKEASNPDEISKGNAFFTNAELPLQEREAIVGNNLQDYLFNVVSSTRIDKNGVADKHSLRRKQVVVPCTLYASIFQLDNEMIPIISNAIHLIKRLGVNRNRGLGRCTISEI